jgi:hypothetical protein
MNKFNFKISLMPHGQVKMESGMWNRVGKRIGNGWIMQHGQRANGLGFSKNQ